MKRVCMYVRSRTVWKDRSRNVWKDRSRIVWKDVSTCMYVWVYECMCVCMSVSMCSISISASITVSLAIDAVPTTTGRRSPNTARIARKNGLKATLSSLSAAEGFSTCHLLYFALFSSALR